MNIADEAAQARVNSALGIPISVQQDRAALIDFILRWCEAMTDEEAAIPREIVDVIQEERHLR